MTPESRSSNATPRPSTSSWMWRVAAPSPAAKRRRASANAARAHSLTSNGTKAVMRPLGSTSVTARYSSSHSLPDAPPLASMRPTPTRSPNVAGSVLAKSKFGGRSAVADHVDPQLRVALNSREPSPVVEHETWRERGTQRVPVAPGSRQHIVAAARDAAFGGTSGARSWALTRSSKRAHASSSWSRS